ncbi:Type-IV pilin [Legionella busanensis]|uniref:Type-IV pilin n=1 Tax=Legionella busanensis TaxID=190655 RepID=A0A378JKM2_9GAMM|nr:type IV pilin protein [Legionella busanensis]STX51876.1 Type-IV pilin [Legionella busanensis]
MIRVKGLNRGFTLIELMIVVVIVAILAVIAYPSYQDYITRGRRADGQAALLDLASRMERYYTQQNTYQTATIGTGNATDVRGTNLSPDQWYTLSITAQTPSTYTLQATPRNQQATNDTRCQTLTLNSLGVKGIGTGPGGAPTGPVSKCW